MCEVENLFAALSEPCNFCKQDLTKVYSQELILLLTGKIFIKRKIIFNSYNFTPIINKIP